MTTAKKLRPANDLHPRASRPMSYVALPRARRPVAHWAATGILVVAAVCVGVFFSLMPHPVLREQPAIHVALANSVVRPEVPEDITVDGAPPESAAPDIQQTETPPSLPQDAHVTVQVDNDGQDAAQLARQAERLQHDGDARQAMVVMRRAAAQDPDNMMYRLRLAIMYDGAGDRDGAARLYHEVLRAYDDDSAVFPASVDIDAIRRRADYLSVNAP
jgi:hypothetical protein